MIQVGVLALVMARSFPKHRKHLPVVSQECTQAWLTGFSATLLVLALVPLADPRKIVDESDGPLLFVVNPYIDEVLLIRQTLRPLAPLPGLVEAGLHIVAR